MALYTALMYYSPDRFWTSPEEAEFAPGYAAFGGEAGAAGVLTYGQALQSAETATTVTLGGGQGSELVVTDGPHADAGEVLGGLYMLEVADRDAANKWAARIPAAWRGRVEPRPVVVLGEPPDGFIRHVRSLQA